MARGFTTMVDMARAPEDAAKDMPMPVVASTKPSMPVYPYGLCISLEDEELKKLGLDGDLPAVGEMIHLAAMAKVTSASASERESMDGTKTQCRRIELTITHLATENEDEEDRAVKWYGDKNGDDDNG